MGTPSLVVSNLTKFYGKLMAVDGLDLTLQSGTIHGLVGPNGAGKTTVLSVIAGLRERTSGEIHFGVPIDKVILMPDTPEFFDFLTAREVVDLARSPFAAEVSEELVQQVIEEVGLADSIDRRVGGFSRGMKQRLGLATTIIGMPELILLDEPCSALDPIGRRDVLNLVKNFRGKSTVLFSTHILSDVESVCDSVTVVDNGKALYEGSVEDLADSKGSFEDAVLALLEPEASL